MENQSNFQYQKKRESLKESQCPSCSTNIDFSDRFCPECGFQVLVDESNCRICSGIVVGDFCENCGVSQEIQVCVKCSTSSVGDFCENCGNPISDLGYQFQNNKHEEGELEILSPLEAQKILEDMDSLLKPDIKKMQEKIRQRVILQREREYFQEREERIRAYNSRSKLKVKEVTSLEYQQIKDRIKNFSGYLEREREKKEEEEREIKRKQEEELKRVSIEKEKEDARKAEEKRQKKINRVSGLWVSTVCETLITLDLRDAQSGSGKAYVSDLFMETVDILNVKWNGSTIDFRTTKIHVKWIVPLFKRIKMKFSGRVSEDGETMTGYVASNETWQEVFIKN